MNFERLEEKLQQQIQGQWYGALQSFFHGTGLDIADFRTYQAGDSPRHINWKLSAKHDELWINKRYEEKDIQVDILLDINANWSAGRRQQNWQIVQQWLSDYLVFTRKQGLQSTTIFAPKRGEIHPYVCSSIENWLASWQQWEQEVQSCAQVCRYRSVLDTFLDRAISQQKQRVILLFSDFLDMTAEQQQRLARLDTQHIVAQIMIDVPEVVGRNFVQVI